MGLKLFKYLALCLLIASGSSVYTQEITVSLANVQILFESGEYEQGALLVDEYLELNPEDLNAKKLKRNILLELDKIESVKKTEEALFYIEGNDLNTAYKLLEDAVRLNPDNEKAFDVFIRLKEVVVIEKDSIIEEEEAALVVSEDESTEETFLVSSGESSKFTVKEASSETSVKADLSPDSVSNADISQLEEIKSIFKIYIPLNLMFSNSNFLSDVQSSLVLGGLGVNLNYSPPVLNNFSWLNISYNTELIKLSGDDRVQYSLHDISVSFALRFLLFPGLRESYTEIYPGIGYSLFILNNTQDEGLYYFETLYSPKIGIRIKDPVIKRFTEKDYAEKLMFRFSLDYSFIVMPNDTISLLDIGLGADYSLSETMGIFFNNKIFIHTAEIATETFNRVDIGLILNF